MEKVEPKSTGKYIVDAFKEKDLLGLAQQIAYSVLFSLGPLLIFVTVASGAVTQVVNSDLGEPGPASASVDGGRAAR